MVILILEETETETNRRKPFINVDMTPLFKPQSSMRGSHIIRRDRNRKKGEPYINVRMTPLFTSSLDSYPENIRDIKRKKLEGNPI